jgi:hypothetical protein
LKDCPDHPLVGMSSFLSLNLEDIQQRDIISKDTFEVEQPRRWGQACPSMMQIGSECFLDQCPNPLAADPFELFESRGYLPQ